MMKQWAWVLGVIVAASVVSMAPTEAQARGCAEGGCRVVVQGFGDRASHKRSMSLHVGFGGMNVSDDGLDPRGAAELGGMNLSWRWDLTHWGGLEVAVGGYTRASEDGLVTESRGMTSVSWLWYFARHKRHRFYGVTGLAGLETDLQIGNSTYSYGEGGMVLGVGTEWIARNRWVVSFDVRALMLSGSDDEQGLVAEEPDAPNDGIDRTPFPAEWYTPAQEHVAVAFNLGLGYRW